MTVHEASKVLGIILPVTTVILKSAFRRRSHETHPDLNKSENASAEFIKVKEAYDYLLTQGDVILDVSDDSSNAMLYTTDGKSLKDLGNGLPHTKAGVPCDNCFGKGYNEANSTAGWVVCPECHGHWKQEMVCRKCGGSGEFKRGGKVVGKCNNCNGKGMIVRYCSECNPKNKNGTFQRELSKLPLEVQLILMRQKSQRYYDTWDLFAGLFGYRSDDLKGMVPRVRRIFHTCTKCKGVGEIELFNPVLRRCTLG